MHRFFLLTAAIALTASTAGAASNGPATPSVPSRATLTVAQMQAHATPAASHDAPAAAAAPAAPAAPRVQARLVGLRVSTKAHVGGGATYKVKYTFKGRDAMAAALATTAKVGSDDAKIRSFFGNRVTVTHAPMSGNVSPGTATYRAQEIQQRLADVAKRQ